MHHVVRRGYILFIYKGVLPIANTWLGLTYLGTYNIWTYFIKILQPHKQMETRQVHIIVM